MSLQPYLYTQTVEERLKRLTRMKRRVGMRGCKSLRSIPLVDIYRHANGNARVFRDIMKDRYSNY
jgi:hypothetical protein